MTRATVAKGKGQRARGRGNPQGTSKSGVIGKDRQKAATSFSERKSIEDIAAEQGIKPTQLEDILGQGADLWESDKELEQFIQDIYVRRREDRELEKR